MKASIWPRIVLALGWIALIVYAFPGQMTADSLDHMREAHDGIYTDAHPPILDVIWRVTNAIASGPIAWLVLQTGMLLGGLYAIFRRDFAPRGAALWATAVFVFPPVAVVMAVIWKDCLMAGLLAVGFAALRSPSRAKRLAGLVAMFGAAAVRYNAFGATFPLVVVLFEWRPGLRWWKRYAIAFAAWLATTVAAFAVNGALTDKPMHYWHSSLAVYDIAGTLANVDGTLPDDTLRAELAGTGIRFDHDIHAAIRAVYTPIDFLPILNDPQKMLWDLPTDGYVPAPAAQRDAIERAWKDVVTTYPGAYVRHRVAVMGEALDIHGRRRAGAVTKRDASASHFQVAATTAMHWLSRHTPLFSPWMYALLALLLLPFTRRHRDVFALLASGLVLELSLLPLVHSRDYRYSHWMVIATIVAAITLVTRRSARPRSSAPA